MMAGENMEPFADTPTDNKGALFKELKEQWAIIRGETKEGVAIEPTPTEEDKVKARTRVNEIQKTLGLDVTDFTKKQSSGSSSGGKKPFVPYQKKTLTIEEKMTQMKAMDDFIANLAVKRLEMVEKNLGKIDVPEKLVFIESWARTIVNSLGR